jgi:hypothetical protein
VTRATRKFRILFTGMVLRRERYNFSWRATMQDATALLQAPKWRIIAREAPPICRATKRMEMAHKLQLSHLSLTSFRKRACRIA